MREHFIYFVKPVGMEGPIKIGCSYLPTSRLDTLTVWSPFPLEILATAPGNFVLERNIHECFANCHSHREWFNASPELKAAIAKIAGGVPVAEAIDLSNRKGSIRSLVRTRRRNWPPERTQEFSYNIRLQAAGKRVRKVRPRHFWMPRDVADIMSRWHALYVNWRGHEARLPTDAERARLDEVLANPTAHFVTYEEYAPDEQQAA